MCRWQEVSNGQHHLRNWKLMLWVVASLLTLVEGVFSEEDLSEASVPKKGTAAPEAWHPDHNPEVQELGKDPDSNGGDFWPSLSESLSVENEEDLYLSRWERSPPDPEPSRRGSRKNRRKPKNTSRDCRIEIKKMCVRDLGLGFDSDEIVLFKYCVGTCLSSRKNYDLALKVLMENGSISGQKVSAGPCCRPTRYETVSFMDAKTIWQTIKWLSAANCSCVG
ncbi:hypothetical protein DPEC_G00339290 [Dallia pectoralis]|uniref:Uncharacterized protein n=1 Tax=Dallia pectoralis TaxID=75939 RepID=A0ACC2F4R4_DALPE|nr:hypothetical protein DPEC_G00339290 [Dallia pectoralis]